MNIVQLTRAALWLAATLAAAGAVSAQSLNLDVGAGFGTPSNAYAAGAGQAGFWNDVDGSSIGTVFALDGLGGAASGATVSYQLFGNGLGNFSFDDPGTSGDDQALMDDCQDVGSGTSLAIWTLDGLNPGSYTVYTYAWASDDPVNSTSNVSVTGSPDPSQTLGGTWPGGHALGVTYSRHGVSVGASGQIEVQIQPTGGFASINGFQIVEGGSGPPATFCTSTPSSLAGCISSMSGPSSTVSKSAGAGSYTLSAGPAPGGVQAGIFIWSKSQLATPVLTSFGWRCIAVTRGTPDLPGGSAGVCDGQYDWDLGDYVNVVGAIGVGDSLFVQGWYRDPPLTAAALFTDGVGPIAVVP